MKYYVSQTERLILVRSICDTYCFILHGPSNVALSSQKIPNIFDPQLPEFFKYQIILNFDGESGPRLSSNYHH